MLDWTPDNRLIRIETKEDWSKIPFVMEHCQWSGGQLLVQIGNYGQDGLCYVDRPESFPCNIYIEGYDMLCHSRIVSDKAAIAYLHSYAEGVLEEIKKAQYIVGRCLTMERKISGFTTPFYPDDYEVETDG